MKIVIKQKDGMEDYEVESAVETLLKAEEIKKDAELMKAVKEKLDKKSKAISSIQDIRDKYSEKVKEENENGEEDSEEDDQEEDNKKSEVNSLSKLKDILENIEANTSLTDDEKSVLREKDEIDKKNPPMKG